MEPKYIQQAALKLNLSLKQVQQVCQLHDEGATIPFMARYRKEATGNLDEVAIGHIVEEIRYFTELEKRKETVLKTIEGLGRLTPELRTRIEDCFEATILEDLYLPYKPKRKTRATTAMEKGLEPLATFIFSQGPGDPETEAAKFIGEQVKDVREALQGARDIVAEWITENVQARNIIRHLFTQEAVLFSKVIASKKEEEEAQKYRDYFEFSEPLAKTPSHRLLAIRRGEKEGFLLMDIHIDKPRAIDELERLLVTSNHPVSAHLKMAIDDCFERLLKPSIENEFRVISKNRADEEAIGVFAENLRQLLLASPLGSKRLLALDPGFRTGCKVVCLDEQGNFLTNTTIYPHPPQQSSRESISEIQNLVDRYDIQAIGIGNGTAGRETEQFIRSIDFGRPVSVFMVNESGASIYSASEVAREEFPDMDLTVRGAVSIGRRLLDPLSELVKIDPKSIGVGQYQHDVNQPKLKEQLDRIVESCVNHVGVNLNTASRHLLMYVSGLSATLARNIVEYRAKNGAFKTRDELRKVSLMGPKTFEQCAAFLRIPSAANPLDNSAVHPESYVVVESMARDLSCSIPDLVGQPELRRRIDKSKYLSETAGEFTLEDILKELEKPGRDPRSLVEEFRFDDSIHSMEDLRPGMSVPGIVTNITNFGVFVDIGVKQDGLIHISQLSNHYISDPNSVVKLQQRLQVTLLEVDVTRKRISLSLKDQQTPPASAGQGRPSGRTMGTSPSAAGRPKAPANRENPVNDFQAKLMELKHKFRN